MPIILEMPALSPSMESGNIISWLKKEGEDISVGDVIAEIETDKAIMEWESIYSGKLEKIVVQAGTQDVAVSSVIGVLREIGDSDADIEQCISNICASHQCNDKGGHVQTIENAKCNSATGNDNKNDDPKCDRIFASPLAKNIARNNNVDLRNVVGTGINSRIVKDDVLKHIESYQSESRLDYSSNNRGEKLQPNINMDKMYNDTVPTGMRKTIANNLLKSKQTIPHFYITAHAMVDKILDFRQLSNKMAITGRKLLIDAFIMKFAANAMISVPEANVSWVNDKIRAFNTVNIAIAISIDGGLVTPTISNVQIKSIAELSEEIHDVVNMARSGKVTADYQLPCSMTLSNLGMYKSVDSFYSIVPVNNGSILSISSSSKQAVVVNDEIVIRNMMKFGYAGDHRCIDGSVAAKWLDAFVECIDSL